MKILRKINGFWLPSRPKIAPRWPQARSRWPQIGPRRLQDVSKTVLKGIFSLLKIDFDFESFWDRFWLHFGSQNASLWAPFWRSKSIKKTIRNRTASKVAPRSPQERPRPSQDAPRTLPESPRTPQEASQTPPGPPPDAPRSSPDPPGRPKTFSEASVPITFFGKIEKFEIVEKKSKKKVDNGHPQWLPALVLTKTESTFKTVEHKGWRRWSREALFNNLCSENYIWFVGHVL